MVKRKLGARYPGGKLKPQDPQPEPAPLAEIKRLRDSLIAQARHPEWGTVCGGLFLLERIGAEQFEAAKRWDRHVTAYRSAIGGPGHVKAIDMNRSYSHPPDPDSQEGRAAAKADVDAVRAFDAAHRALALGGPVVYAAVQNAVERGEHPVGYDGLMALKVGLSLLADHWGLTNQGKSATGRHHPKSRSSLTHPQR